MNPSTWPTCCTAAACLGGAIPDRESVQQLIELAAGRITIDEYKCHVLKAGVADRAAGSAIAQATPPRRFGRC